MFFVTQTARFLKNFVLLFSLTFVLYACDEAPNNAGSAGPRAEEVASRLVALVEDHGKGKASYASATYNPSDDEVTITEFKVTAPTGESGSITVAELVLTGPKTPEDGTFSADSLIATNGVGSGDDDEKLTFARITEKEFFIPTKTMLDNDSGTVAYSMVREILVEEVVFGPDPTGSIARINYSRGELDNGLPKSIVATIDGIEMNVEDIGDEEVAANLRALGYEHLNLNASLDWEWDDSTSSMAVGPIVLTMVDAGADNLRIELGGITRDLLMATNSDDALELVQLITLNSFELVFKDDSITGRAIAYTAQQLGVDQDSVITLWLDQLRQGLAEIETPQTFNLMVISAAQKFLNDPKKFTISMNPSTPLPVSQVMGSFMFGPAAIIPLLNINMVAN